MKIVTFFDERDKSSARQALRVKTRQWMASKFDATKFGDKMQMTGKDDQPLIPGTISLVVDFGE